MVTVMVCVQVFRRPENQIVQQKYDEQEQNLPASNTPDTPAHTTISFDIGHRILPREKCCVSINP
jgi:hypothetical protein